MAIRRSPGVTFIERDSSEFAPNINSSVVGLVGFATKGPVNKATLITSPQSLIRIFGEPSEGIPGQGIEGAIEILETTDQLYFVRAGVDANANEASATIDFGVCPAVQVSANEYGVNNPLYLEIQVKNHLGVNQFSTTKRYAIPANTAGTGEGQSHALTQIIGGGDLPTDKVGVISNADTSTTGYVVGSFPGSGTTLEISAYNDSTYDANDGILVLQEVNVTGGVEAVASSVTVKGATITSGLSYVVSSLYPGTGYNYGTKSNGDASGLSIELDSLGGKNTELTVNDADVGIETFRISLVGSGNYVEDIIEDAFADATSDHILGELYFSGSPATPTPLTDFIQTLDNLGLVHVRTVDGDSNALTTARPRFVKWMEGTNNMSGGTDGTGTDSENQTALIGDSSDKTGMQALNDDSLNISLASVPGITAQNVQNNLVTLAETSNQFVALVSPPQGLTVQQAVDWVNGRGNGRTASLNSSWAALAWPWVQIFSVFDGKDRWYDPAIFVARQMTFTDNVAEAWFAPAGFRRGRLTKPTDVEVALNEGDMNTLYDNNINPIVKFVPEGITIWGQKTLQRTPTALDRINVRRLMIFIRKQALALGRIYVFEPNDEFLWEQVEEAMKPPLSDIKQRRGITQFQVVCDETTNTPARGDRNELWCKILIKPTKAAEFIVFEANLTNQSAKFGE